MRRRRLTVWCVAAWLAWTSCVAQENETVVVGLTRQWMPQADGNVLSVDWIGRFDSNSLSVGAHRTQVGAAHWGLFGVGGAKTLGRDWMLTGDVALGPARTETGRHTFKRLRAEILIPVSKRWLVSAQDLFVDMDPVAGHLISGGARLAGDNGRSFDLHLSRSIAGNLDSSSALVRFDTRAAPPFIMAGVALGRSNNRLLLQVPGTELDAIRLREGFFGLTFPLQGLELTMTISVARIGDLRRTALSAVFRVPVRPSG